MALHNNESIYNILYKPPPTPPRSPRYQATMRYSVSGKIPVKPFATMGPAELPIEAPQNFLKKGEGFHPPPPEPCLKQCLSAKRLPPVPKSASKEKDKDEPKCKNFRLENIRRVSQMKPKSAQRTLVDSPDGHKYTLDQYDLKYVFRENYGQVPKYIIKKKTQIRQMQEDFKKHIDNKEPLCKQVSAEEREALLNGLKMNRDELQKKFLLLPVLTDTIPKVNKKRRLEQQLKELEKDIDLLEKHPYIYIYD